MPLIVWLRALTHQLTGAPLFGASEWSALLSVIGSTFDSRFFSPAP